MKSIAKTIPAYNAVLRGEEKKIASILKKEIDISLKGADSKIWHGGPVWFLDSNPIVGYWVRKDRVHIMFWSGMSFVEPKLVPIGNVKKFKAAGFDYTSSKDVNLADLRRWLRKSKTIQWDYKNIIKRKGKLIRLKAK